MFSQIFIERPKLAMVISIVTIIAGTLCIFQAPIAEYPEIAPPTIMVWANYTGAGAQEVANTVATVIEEQMNGLEDLLYFSSSSSDSGTYMLEITFEPGTDTDIALVNVQNAVKRAEPLLPQTVIDNGVRQFKRSGDILSLYNFTTDGSKLSLIELSNFIRTNVRDPLTRIPGVSEVNIMGERNYSMRTGRRFPPRTVVKPASATVCGISWACCATAQWSPAAWTTRATLRWATC